MHIDIDERALFERDNELLKILLKDRTTRKHLVWGTDSYAMYGKGFQKDDPIALTYVLANNQFIQPRVAKRVKDQKERTRKSAEVFTPTWVVDKQVSTVDQEFSQLELEEYLGVRWLDGFYGFNV